MKKKTKKKSPQHKLTITLEKLISIINAIREISKESFSTDLNFKIIDNRHMWKDVVDPLMEKQALFTGPREEFEKKRVALCEKFANKDDKGQPVIIEREYDIPSEKKEEFNGQLATLREEYDKSGADEAEIAFVEHVKNEVEIEYVPIPRSLLPANLSAASVEALYEITTT